MGQLGFFDAERRLAALSEKGDPLEAIIGSLASKFLGGGGDDRSHGHGSDRDSRSGRRRHRH